ncbi:hypothetical protein JW933_02990 [candidate division FCPU426 bacterium]|nr:hypothetical protein [candidate division FCPU426 bacterium]
MSNKGGMMGLLVLLYYLACGLVWLGLTILASMAVRQGFPEWLRSHPKTMVCLLGTNRMPAKPVRTLRRFYLFLCGGFTWLLVWSWWIMPPVKNFFFKSIPTPVAFKIARISTLVVVIAYAAAGFFAIGRAVTIWFKEIYRPALEEESEAGDRDSR